MRRTFMANSDESLRVVSPNVHFPKRKEKGSWTPSGKENTTNAPNVRSHKQHHHEKQQATRKEKRKEKKNIPTPIMKHNVTKKDKKRYTNIHEKERIKTTSMTSSSWTSSSKKNASLTSNTNHVLNNHASSMFTPTKSHTPSTGSISMDISPGKKIIYKTRRRDFFTRYIEMNRSIECLITPYTCFPSSYVSFFIHFTQWSIMFIVSSSIGLSVFFNITKSSLCSCHWRSSLQLATIVFLKHHKK